MKPKHIVAAVLCACFFIHLPVHAQDMDKELETLAQKLSTLIKENGNKKVTVLDFTDLQGGSSELGKYIAEELTVNLVIGKSGFSVLDRAHLRRILAEHKLTATGLIDPENAKKLGMFAGVDAMIFGTMIPKGSNMSLNAKIITTETAEIVGAARAEFKADDSVRELSSRPSTSDNSIDLKSESAQVTKTFGDLKVELLPVEIVSGDNYLLTFNLINTSKKSLWVAVKIHPNGSMPASLTDSYGTQFETSSSYVSGVETSSHDYKNNFMSATELKPDEPITATIKFFSPGHSPTAGVCNLQLAFLEGPTFRDNYGAATAHNLVTKIEARQKNQR